MATINPQYYPESYDDILSSFVQESFMKWLNNQQQLINFYEKQRHCGVKELEDSAARFQKENIDNIEGVKSLLSSIGVYIGYNMVGYRDKWTLVTYDIAVSQLEWEEQCNDYYD
uniref:Uncharacterized protein n=1 Tax=Siphoviridae sp. ctZHD14 TaxID=2827891 RepID=A0A8S5SXE7_9CAUD|nr:MAG TPA: hypothetical protein [Siphoviridae sp. ctZHD14]